MSQHHCMPASPRAQGLQALAAAPWQDAFGLLLSAAPLSAADCRLWADMLPLLQRLVGAAEPGQDRLQRLAQQFAGGSALEWLQQLDAGPAAGGHEQAALLQAVLHTVRQITEHAQRRSNAGQRTQLLLELQAQDWLSLLPQLLQHAGYAGRVAALRLATALVDALGSCPSPGWRCGPAVGALLSAALQRVLMPRELWGTAHRHGKAAVLAALQLLLAITRAAPAGEWAAAWAGVGSTYWLSRAASDSSPAVRQAALRLLAAALAVPATHSLLAGAWPECGDVAVQAAVDASQPAAVRAAALAAVAAALSHGPAGQPGSISEAQLPPEQAEEEAGEQQGDQENQQQPSQLVEGGASLARLCSPTPVVPPLESPPLPAMAAERLLQRDELWACVDDILQVRGKVSLRTAHNNNPVDVCKLLASHRPRPHSAHPTFPLVLQGCDACNALLSAATAASLQRLLLDAEGAGSAASAAVLLRLLRLPAAAAEAADTSGGLPLEDLRADQACSLQHAVHAARSAASLVAAAAQLAPRGLWAELAASPDLLPAAAGAFSRAAALSCGALPEVAEPEVQVLQRCSQTALAGLADTAALLAQAAVAGASHAPLQAACDCAPLPLAVTVAAALNGAQQWPAADLCGSDLSAACCRLLAVALQQQEAAAAFLLGPDGSEHQLPADVGTGPQAAAAAALCGHLLEWLVASAAEEDSAPGSPQQAALHAALGGLLCSSRSAKRVALSVGLHHSLTDSCCSLAAGLGSPQAAAAPAAPPAAVMRAGKLARLKQRRACGTGGGAVGAKRASASLAFGSRLPSQPAGGRASPARPQPQPGLESGAQLPANAAGMEAAPACSQPAGEQRLLLCLRLLQQLAHGCEASGDALVEAGALRAAAQLWGAGSAAVQHGLLGLLGTLLACSPAARQALATTGACQPGCWDLQSACQCLLLALSTLACISSSLHSCTAPLPAGEPPLLERLLALVLAARPLPSATAAAAALAGLAASADGARLLLHTSGLPPRALRALQDHAAAKDWRRLLPTLQVRAAGREAPANSPCPKWLLPLPTPTTSLTPWPSSASQVLADVCSQPEAQRAALACTCPSDSLPGVLLALATPEAAPPAGGAAGQAAAAEAAMLVLRQLALSPQAKAWFCSQHGALAQLLGAVGAAEQAPVRAAAAAHALWALVHGSGGERAKVSLRRCSDWGGALAAATAACERGAGAAWAPQLRQGCAALRRLLA